MCQKKRPFLPADSESRRASPDRKKKKKELSNEKESSGLCSVSICLDGGMLKHAYDFQGGE